MNNNVKQSLHITHRAHRAQIARVIAAAAGRWKGGAVGRPLTVNAEARNGRAEIRIEGMITRFWNGSEDFRYQVDRLIEQGYTDAHLYIKSEGGDVFEANEIANIIKKFPGEITGEGGSMVASAATYIALYCATFAMPSNGQFMIHKPSGIFEGTAEQIEQDLKALKNIQEDYKARYALKTNSSEEDIENLWANGNYWMSAQEAKDRGFLDHVTDEVQIEVSDIHALRACGAPNVPPAPYPPKPQTNKPNHLNSNNMDTQAMALTLGLKPTASEEKIKEEVEALKNDRNSIKAKYDELEKKRKQEDSEAHKQRFLSAFDQAINEKRITEDYREGYKSKFDANPDATIKEIEALKPAPNLSAHTGSGNSVNNRGNEYDQRSDWTYEKYMEEAPQDLREMMEEDPRKFNALAKARYGNNFTPLPEE